MGFCYLRSGFLRFQNYIFSKNVAMHKFKFMIYYNRKCSSAEERKIFDVIKIIFMTRVRKFNIARMPACGVYCTLQKWKKIKIFTTRLRMLKGTETELIKLTIKCSLHWPLNQLLTSFTFSIRPKLETITTKIHILISLIMIFRNKLRYSISLYLHFHIQIWAK